MATQIKTILRELPRERKACRSRRRSTNGLIVCLPDYKTIGEKKRLGVEVHLSNFSRLLFSTLVIVMIAPVRFSAQVTSGTIVGAATDPTGAVVPNAGITVTHVGTKDTRRTQTNERGEFNLPFVRIGEHSISAEAQGFRTQTQTGIVQPSGPSIHLRMSFGSVCAR